MKAIQSIEAAKRELKKCDEAREQLQNKYVDFNRRKDKIFEDIEKQSLSIRITRITDKVIQIREKILTNKILLSFLKETNISIESVALVEFVGDRIRKHDFGPKRERSHFWEYPDKLLDPEWNLWDVSIRYIYGGPSDPVRVFFKRPNNSQKHYVCGFMTNFPMKLEKKAA
jgi:hypothetical protein